MNIRILLACVIVAAGLACYLRQGPEAVPSLSSDTLQRPPLLREGEGAKSQSEILLSEARAMPSTWTEPVEADLYVPYGKEFWRKSRVTSPSSEPPAHGIDVFRVRDRVSHALSVAATGGFKVDARDYQARVIRDGVSFSPKAIGGEMGFGMHLETVNSGRAAEWSVTGNVAQRRLGDEEPLVEHVEFGATGAELSWILSKRPSGDEFQVEVTVSGMHVMAARSDALHFGGEDGVARVRIGEAVAVDSAGRRLPLALVATGGGFHTTVPGAFLDSAVYPIAIDPLIEAEYGIDQPVPQLAKTAQFAPALASSGEHVLVVWRDSDRVDGEDIFGARVSFDGQVIDLSGLAIATGSGDQIAPDVASDGTDYLVVWEDEVGKGDIFARRISGETGELLDEDAIRLVDDPAEQSAPSVEGMSGQYLVAWQDFRNNSASLKRDIYGTRISSSGEMLNEEPFEIVSEENNQNFPAIASNGSNWLVVWHDLRDGSSFDVYGTLISATGEFLTPNEILIAEGSDSEWNVSATSVGSGYFVVWQNRNGGAEHDVFGARIDGDGVLIDEVPIAICEDDGDQTRPVVGAVGGMFLVVWEDSRNSEAFSNRDIFGMRINEDGTLVDEAAFALTSAEKDQRNPAVTSTGAGLLVAWEDFRNGEDNDIFGTRITADGDPVLDVDGIWFSTIGNEQAQPHLATNGTDWLVAWEDLRNGEDYDLYGSRVDGATLEVMDVEGILISDAVGDQREAVIASDGTDYLVVWSDFRNGTDYDVYGAKVLSEDGSVSNAGKKGLIFKIDKNQVRPDIAASDENYFVVWQDERATANHDIYGMRIDWEGVVMDTAPLLLTVNFQHQHRPSVSSSGTDFFVAWEDHRNENDIDIYGNLYRSATSSPDDFDGVLIGGGEGDQWFPSVMGMGSEFVVAWINDGSGKDELFTAGVTNQGELDGPSAVRLAFVADGDVSAIDLESNGFNFLLAWEVRSPDGVSINSARLGSKGGVPDGEIVSELLAGESGLSLGAIGGMERREVAVFLRPDSGGTTRTTIAEAEFNVLPRLVTTTEPTVFDEGSDPIAIAPEMVVDDPDSPDFETGRLIVRITSGAEPDDRIAIIASDEIGISTVGNIVSYEGSPIGIFTGGRSGTAPLDVILTGFATVEAVQALARSVGFQNSATPPANRRRVISFTASDGDDGTSGAATKEITINTISGPPIVLVNPLSRTVSLDETVTLSVAARGTAPLKYQWRFNGVNVEGGNGAALVIDDITVADAGTYDVIVTNALGSDTSDPATLSFLSIDRCVTWNSVIGQRYYVEARITEEDEWQGVSETIIANESSTQFCVPITSDYALFRVAMGEAPAVSADPSNFVTVGIFLDRDSVLVRWVADPERLYSIHSKRSLGEEGWTLLESRIVPDGANGRYRVDTTSEFHFFRVVRNP